MITTAHTLPLLESLAHGTASAAELTKSLGISQPTLSRAMAVLEGEGLVARSGSTRGARYSLMTRTVDDIGAQWPLYRVDEEGHLHELGAIHALARNQYIVTRHAGQNLLERMHGLFDGVPYYLQDARPGGFLGRAVATAYPELALPSRVIDWADDHFLVYLTRRGTGNVGDLIVGAEALNRYIDAVDMPPLVRPEERSANYPALARAAMEGTPPGSSAPGEQPKFIVSVGDRKHRTEMIVKFSPPAATAMGQRWADLLVAEHLAHKVLAEREIPACRSTVHRFEDRVFLEVERFDRIGLEGRRGAVSLLALDAARYGRLDNWAACAQRLAADALLSAQDAGHIRLLDLFGALIANTDRHFGNVTLFDEYAGPLQLAPVYDMLPMLFAPQNDQIVERQYEPARPTAASLSLWPHARALAEDYWELLTQEPRLSDEFRELSARCLAALRAVPSRGVLASSP
jgi:DNA-binding transcriptional ArsR family regulator